MTVNPRQALSYHCTTVCQVGKADGPAGSLKASGLETQHRQGEGFVVKLKLSHAFEAGDKLKIQYESPVMKTFKEAQRAACVELLAFLLVSAPGKVLMHPNNWKGSHGDIAELRSAAHSIHDARPVLCDGKLTLAGRVKDDLPRRPQALASPPGLDQPMAANAALDEQAVLYLRSSLTLQREYGPQRARIPAVVGRQLGMLLPKRGFAPFLKRHPLHFSVTSSYTSGKEQCSFKLLPFVSSCTQPAVGGSSSSSGVVIGVGGSSSASGVVAGSSDQGGWGSYSATDSCEDMYYGQRFQ